MKPILKFDLSAEAYHAEVDSASNSSLSLLKRSPAHMKYALANPVESPAMRLGTLVHTAVLEADLFDSLYVSGPEGDRRKKAVREEWAELTEEHGEEYVMKPDAFSQILAIRDAVSSHPLASRLLLGSRKEASCFWEDEFTGVRCKARLDALPAEEDSHIVCDLKTTADVSTFAKSCYSFSYHRQASHYLEAWRECGDDEREDFVFVAVEKTPPYGIGVFSLEPAALELGRIELDRLLRVWEQCEREDSWDDGYPEHCQELSLPAWAYSGEVL